MDKYTIHVVSDSIGDTAEMVAKAAAEQFGHNSYRIMKHSYVIDEKRIAEVIRKAKKGKSLVIFTTVVESLRKILIDECRMNAIPFIDVMGPILINIESIIGSQPSNMPGVIHRLDDKYYEKVEAMEFAVKYDDGKDTRGILEANVVLLGVSRTSKTPLSIYLAMRNIKVANVPLLPEISIPKEVYMVPKGKIIGLTNDPVRLNQIRKERLRTLGLDDDSSYADMGRIMEELEYAGSVMKSIGCSVIDVSNKAIEETAGIIEEIILKSSMS